MKGFRTEPHHEDPFPVHLASKDAKAPHQQSQRLSLMRSLLDSLREQELQLQEVQAAVQAGGAEPPSPVPGEQAPSLPGRLAKLDCARRAWGG